MYYIQDLLTQAMTEGLSWTEEALRKETPVPASEIVAAAEVAEFVQKFETVAAPRLLEDIIDRAGYKIEPYRKGYRHTHRASFGVVESVPYESYNDCVWAAWDDLKQEVDDSVLKYFLEHGTASIDEALQAAGGAK